jgi:OOP family OmpA-OmpF porin
MQIIKPLGAVALASVLAACATAENVDRLNQATATGSPFSQKLAQEYRQIAAYERDEMYDWQDATYFADKGLNAAGGEVVAPEQLDAWNLPSDKMDELSSARGDLTRALDGNARRNHPELAGHAQGRFDCWVEQQEENHQPEHIARCREAYYEAMSKLQAAMQPEPDTQAAPAPEEPEQEPMMEPERFTVYFGFDQATVPQGETGKVREAAMLAEEMEDVQFSVTGHADRAGPADYNQELSLRRARNVRDALSANGVSGDAVSIAARGESEPAVPTGDGVREPENRRVVITVQ